MQREGKPQFLTAHTGHVKGVAFSPKDRYIFCSGGTDGKINLYHALRAEQVLSIRITNPGAMKSINAVKFNSDGSRILSTTSKRLSVINVERGDVVCSYENCAFAVRDRAPLAVDPQNPNLAICGCTNGKGLITFDLRKQTPAHFALNVHSSLIRDIIYLDGSWPFVCPNDTVASISDSGVCKIRTVDNKEIDDFDVKHRSYCIAATPETYSQDRADGYDSLIMIGGDCLSKYVPRLDEPEKLLTFGYNERPIRKLKYTSNGSFLYAISNDGQVRRYRRTADSHELIGQIYCHEDEIYDMDISEYDEYIVTASKDKTVGLMCLGTPSHGWTGFVEMT